MNTEINFSANRLTVFPSKYAKNTCYMISHGEIVSTQENSPFTPGPIIVRGQLSSNDVNV